MRTPSISGACAVLMLITPGLGAVPAAAQPQPPRQERVTFAKGASSATIKGQLRGDTTIDYLVRAAAGQTITVALAPSNKSTYFNVLPPGSNDVAMYVAQTADAFKSLLPADGDYTIRVYLMRNAARRNESSTYTLTVGITGKALAPLSATRDALIAGTSFHASGAINCVPFPYGDTTPKKCEAFVIRRGIDGTATVEIARGEMTNRRILFVQGRPLVSDSSEAMTSDRQSDVTIVTFDSGERYEIPDALITGG